MSGIAFTPFTHESMVKGVHAIAEAADAWKPTLLVGVGRGGLTPAVFLSHRMGLPMVSIDHSTGMPQFGGELVKVLAEQTRNGERLLFVEDINDSGKTIGEIRGALTNAGAVAEQIHFAVLINNSKSRQKVEYAFDTIDRSVTKDWFIFPWEAMAPKSTLEEDAVAVPERIG